jgi:endoglucanase
LRCTKAIAGLAAVALLGLSDPAAGQLADRFTPASEALPTTGPRLPLGKCLNLSNVLDASSEGACGRAFVDGDIGRIADAGFTAIRRPARLSAHAGRGARYTVDRRFVYELWQDDSGWVGGAATCITAPVPAPVAAAPEGSPVARHGALSVEGGKIIGAHGAPVTLRGMSLFWSQWAPQYYDAETVAWLARDWKVDVVRAAIAAEGNDSARQHFDREFAKASTVIDAAVAHGLYVIVDWHAHRPYPAEAERFLTAIARKYGHLPNLIYEPFNEPLREGVEWSRDVKPYHLQVIGAVRAIDPDNLVIAGSTSWSQDVDIAAADPLPFANLAYTLHYYAATHGQELRAKGDAALARGAALLITEFGTVEASGNGPIDYAESEAWWAWAEEHDVGWMAWSIGDRDETSAALKPGTPPSGWSDQDLTESGRLLRERLRAAAGRNPACQQERPGLR